MKHLKTLGQLLKETFKAFLSGKDLKFSASLAYYTMFSLPPMLIVIISLCGTFFGQDAVEGTIYGQISDIVGQRTAMQIQELIKDVHTGGNTRFATVIGAILLAVGATGVFTEIQDSINFIWRVKAKPKKGWVKMIMNRVISFSMIISIGFILMVSLVISATLALIGDELAIYFPDFTLRIFKLVNYLLSFTVITVLFAIIFKVLPDAKIRWKDVIIGAVATAILFILGKYAITFYLSRSSFANANGATGSIIALLSWIYYSAAILYLGAEFTQVYACRYGDKIVPTEYAVSLEIKEIEKDNGDNNN